MNVGCTASGATTGAHGGRGTTSPGAAVRQKSIPVDGAVNGTAALIDGGAWVLRRLQTGSVRAYAMSLLVGVVMLVGYYLWP